MARRKAPTLKELALWVFRLQEKTRAISQDLSDIATWLCWEKESNRPVRKRKKARRG